MSDSHAAMAEEIANLRRDLAAAQNVKALLAEEVRTLKKEQTASCREAANDAPLAVDI